MAEETVQIRKCVTCHAGSRDSYALSVALQECNLLDCLVTDFYTPDIACAFYGKRHHTGLPSSKVVSLWSTVLYQKLFHQPFHVTDSILSKYALKTALHNRSNLFLCSYTASEAFSAVKKQGLENLCLLFQLHPHPSSIKKILEEEIRLVPIASDSILGEIEMDENSLVVKRLIEESCLADRCVVASSFTKETLMENGVREDTIKVIPYGVDSIRFPKKTSYNLRKDNLNVIFLGQMIQRKGLYYLLEAIKSLRSKSITLTIVGRGSIDHKLLAAYSSELNINVRINLSHSDLINELHMNDVLVFPSLIEGFGHVILEAMSAGIPVICTPNTAGRDVFLTGKEGFIVPIRSSEILAEKIEWCLDHKKELQDMGVQAAETARDFTWDKFRKDVRQFYVENAS